MTSISTEIFQRNAEETKNPRRIKTIYVYMSIFNLIIFSEAFLPMVDISRDYSIIDARKYFVAATTVISVILYLLNSKKIHTITIYLLILHLYILVLTIWSVDFNESIGGSIIIITNFLFCWHISSNYNIYQFTDILAKSFKITLLCSLVAVFFIPSIGVHAGDIHEGAWRGVFYFKNHLGRFSALASLVFLFRAIAHSTRSPSKEVMWYFLAVLLVIGSRSANALVLLGVSTVIIFGTTQLRRKRQIILIVAIVAVMATVLLVSSFLDDVLGFLGKDITLTGRTQIWNTAVTFITMRPWVGYGYNAFWSKDAGFQPVFGYLAGWLAVPHAHNGFLNMSLGIGVLASTFVLLLNLKGIIHSLLCFLKTGDLSYTILLSIFMFIFLVNISESEYMEYNRVIWIVFVSCILLSARERTTPSGKVL